REQHEVNRRQIFDPAARALDSLQQKKPVREIRIDEHVQIIELHEERRVANPGDGDLAVCQFRKVRPSAFAVARREPGLPNHLVEKSARIEMIARRELLEGTWNPATR